MRFKKGKEMKKFLVTFLTLLCLCFSALAKNIEAEGVAATAQGAEREALRSAVEEAVGVYVGSNTLQQKYQIIQDTILTHSQGYVTDYQVIQRQQRPDGLWRVKIKAEIDELADAKLLSELAKQGIINVVLRNPKIAVQVSYTINTPVTDWAAHALTEELVNTGFKRACVGKIPDADFIVRCKIRYKDKGDIGKYMGDGRRSVGTRSAVVSLTAQLTQVSTGKNIALGSKNMSAVAGSLGEALRKASQKVGREMGKYIVEQLLILGSGPALKEE